MMKNSNSLMLGYDLDCWEDYGIKQPISVDISPSANSHILICGMSGSGKTYAESSLLCRFVLANPNSEIYFSDYKQEDSFSHLRGCSHYYPYKRTLEALEIVYDKLQKRQSGEDNTRHAIVLLWDEYVANMLWLQNENKKIALSVMSKISEILMLGRTLNTRIICSCQRGEASVFPSGSRLNYGVIMILGASNRSMYEMLIPDHIEFTQGREFQRGEGVVLLQGSKLCFIKIPTIKDESKMHELCIKALSW